MIRQFVSYEQLIVAKTWTEPAFRLTALSTAYALTNDPVFLQYWLVICLSPFLLIAFLFVTLGFRRQKHTASYNQIPSTTAVFRSLALVIVFLFILAGNIYTYIPISGMQKFAVFSSPIFGPFFFALAQFGFCFFSALPVVYIGRFLLKFRF
jgi:hypothetical protein